ncbi:MAG: hypothetical protein DRN18_00635 [Thermoplasmata archaeon]|nr:MAG: hypothetical protein DRN18_00635 [Thermoplasmata archaeon]
MVIPVVVSFLLLTYPIHVTKAQGIEEGAEENLYVVGDLPLVKIGEDTEINLVFEDHIGLNFSRLTNLFPNKPFLSFFFGYIYIPVVFGPMTGMKTFKNIYCLHTIEFYAYIEGNISGWHAIVEPSVITGSTDGKRANLTLKVRIDGPTVYPMANVVIKVVRKGANGTIIGVSYHKISLKAEHIYLLDIKPLKSAVETSPGSSVSIPVEITNLGNYVENYIISVEGEGASAISSGQTITIDPGETIKTYIHVYTPFSIFDPGTSRKIEIKAYPARSPDNVFTAGASVITRGVSPIFIPVLILIAILIVLIVKMLLQFGKGFTWTKKGKVEEEIKRKFFSVGAEKKETVRESVKMKSEVKSISSKPRSLGRKDLEKLMAKIKKEEMKQKRKFEKTL